MRQFKIICITLTAIFGWYLISDNAATAEPAVTAIYPAMHCLDLTSDEALGMAGLGRGVPIDSIALASGLERLYAALREDGYPLARLDSTAITFGSDTIQLYLSRGPALRVAAVSAVGNPALASLRLPAGGRLTKPALDDLAGSAVDNLNENGFPYAQLSPSADSISVKSVAIWAKVSLNATPGEFIRLSDVVFPGAQITRPRTLLLETRLKRGDPFKQKEMQRATARLERLPYVASVMPIVIRPSSPGYADIIMPIKERRVNQFSGVIAASPGASKPAGEITIAFGNLFGTGRSLQFEWHNLNPQRQGIRAAYCEPWIFGAPIHLNGTLEQWSGDTLGASTRRHLGLEWEAADGVILSGGFAAQTFQPASSLTSVIASNTSVWDWGFTGNLMDRDWNPSKGYRLSVSSALGFRRWRGSSSPRTTIRRENGSAAIARPLGVQWVAIARGEIEDVAGSGVIADDLLRLGGITTVRGYLEESLLARGAVWGSAEIRWRPDPDSYLGLFADLGRIYRRDTRFPLRAANLRSVGISLGLLTDIGRIETDIAIPSGEPIRNARFHVSLSSWF